METKDKILAVVETMAGEDTTRNVLEHHNQDWLNGREEALRNLSLWIEAGMHGPWEDRI